MENQNRYRNFCAVILFFSSWVLIFLTAGIVVEDWVHLNTENMPNTKNKPISHSPWKSSKDDLWQGDNTENIRIMMGIILSLAFFYNFFLGLGFTYMIPRNEHSCFTSIVLSFLTGMFLLITLLAYHYNIKQGHHRFSNYKLTWITFINYVNVFILITSEYKKGEVVMLVVQKEADE
ncbi:transmembrane protein 225 [Sorex fumeus]|uniref:transmembrane protein 225 n=1 Tax=Sorex fumeus TaxID=62283 RepID=UPI0024AE109A|nr:transmembrane protein 225 [Sorex fumeus]